MTDLNYEDPLSLALADNLVEQTDFYFLDFLEARLSLFLAIIGEDVDRSIVELLGLKRLVESAKFDTERPKDRSVLLGLFPILDTLCLSRSNLKFSKIIAYANLRDLSTIPRYKFFSGMSNLVQEDSKLRD
ncbi:hypothetical protein BpHYR1_046257 [Brachionus plicatilis]|uniref:Uncharacterized protein n=1 Tax=Brachionus plicatilis TaxID=10195 RepID=A0A3M7S579_BRAPC|nr:hypothetical protein BpHYR1_046257 [Brachionus plicatilis]